MKYTYRFPPRSKLEKWIRANGGTKTIAKKLKVNQTSVQHWCIGRSRPGLRSTAQLLTLSAGKLTLRDLIVGTRGNGSKRN